jgi:membrane-associated phospholipid phosphatase
MQPILDWGARIIIWLQQVSPLLDWPMRIITLLGDAPFLFCVVFFLYWNVDRRVGARLALLFIFSTFINIAAKVISNQPRPYMVNAQIQQLASAQGGGLPSGHTQAVTVVWLFLAFRYRKRWLVALAMTMLLLVPLSRVYLGVHYPTDLLGGYVIGLALLGIWHLAAHIERWLLRRARLWALLLITVLPILAILSAGYGEDASLILGAGTGFVLGLALERRWLHYDCSGSVRQQLLRFALGAIPALLLFLGGNSPVMVIFHVPLVRFSYYTLLGLWVALGAPWLFQRLGLATACRIEV